MWQGKERGGSRKGGVKESGRRGREEVGGKGEEGGEEEWREREGEQRRGREGEKRRGGGREGGKRRGREAGESKVNPYAHTGDRDLTASHLSPARQTITVWPVASCPSWGCDSSCLLEG